MFNTLRADFYRLFRSKGFYITQILLLLLVFLSVLTEAIGTMGVQIDELDQLQTTFDELTWTGAQVLSTMSTMSVFLLYFCLPLLTLTIGYDLTRSTNKNLLTSGVSRLNFFVSKYLVFVVFSIYQLFFYYAVAFLTASVKNGVGEFGNGFLTNFLRAFGIQVLCLHAVFAVAILVLYLLFSNVSAVITVVVFPLAISVMQMIFPKVSFFQYINFQTNMNAAWIETIGPENYWLKVAVSCILFIFVSLTISYQVFRRKNL